MKTALTSVLTIALTGCASFGNSDYSCSGIDGGVRCKSAREVYNSPGNKDTVVQNVTRSKETAPHVVPKVAKSPLPIRTPSKVLRIWLAPWEDDAGDLHVPAYIYSEIEPKRWQIGQLTAENGDKSLYPLQVDQPTKTGTSESSTSN